VYIVEEKSKLRLLNNGLSQGSVLASLLFNLYTKDLPLTSSRKFIYADDIALASQTYDFGQLNSYFKRWRLKPNLLKTEETVFHLNNRMSILVNRK